MIFSDNAAYWENSARSWQRVFGKKRGTMHAAIRDGNSSATLRSQFYAEELVCRYIQEKSAQKVFDCGSGYGESMLYISNIYPEIVISGICASEPEIDETRATIRESDKINNVRVFCGDFEDAANYRVFPLQDIVYCIDSIRYARNIGGLLRIMHQHASPEGIVIICDYFHERGKIGTVSATKGVLSSLRTQQEVISAASDSGFKLVLNEDWSKESLRSFAEVLAGIPLALFAQCFDRTRAGVYGFRAAMEQGIRRESVSYRAIVLQKT